MVKKPTKNNYRKYYKEYFNIDFGEKLHVHHIDGDRDNNAIDNLLLIPINLHKRYHEYENIVKPKLRNGAVSNVVDSVYLLACIVPYYTDCLDFGELLKDMNFWIDLKHQQNAEMNESKTCRRNYYNFYQIEIDKYERA